MSDRFHMAEAELLQLVGITADDLGEIRTTQLMFEEHVVRKSRGYFYSEDGLQAILAIVGAKAAEGGPGEKTALASQPAAASREKTASLVVERCCPNPIWVQCRVDGALVNVRVADNRRMVRGTRLNGCRFLAGRWAWDGRGRA